MANFSLSGEDILVKPGRYYILDAVFSKEIKKKIDGLNPDDLDRDIREKVFPFPYTDIPFTKMDISSSLFEMRKIKKVDYENVGDLDKKSCFAVDSGMIIIVEEKVFVDFIRDYDYDAAVDSIQDPINFQYWENLSKKYNNNSIALVLAPGVGSGFEFEGSGTYRIQN